MKRLGKRLLTLLLAAILLGTLYVPARAATLYDLTIDGVCVDDDNCADVLENGVFSYDPQQNVLTISGDYTTAANTVISNNIPGLVIYVAQDSALSTSGGNAISLFSANTTITGPGTLTLTNSVYASYSALTIEDGTVHVACDGKPVQGADVSNKEKLILRNANLTATSTNGKHAVSCFRGGIEMYGCEFTDPVTAYISNSGGIYNNQTGVTSVTISAIPYAEYDLTIDGVRVTTQNRADVLENGVFAFDGNHTLTIKGDYASTGTIIESSINCLEIEVADNVSLSSSADGFDLQDTTAITGAGKLTLTVPAGCGIRMHGGQLTFNGSNVDVTASEGALVGVDEAKLMIISADVTATATDLGGYAIRGFTGGITLDRSFISSPNGGKIVGGRVTNSEGITASSVKITALQNYSLWIDGVRVTAQNRADPLGNGVFSFDGEDTLTISGDYVGEDTLIKNSITGLVVEVAQDSVLSSSGGYGIYTNQDMTITGPGALTLTSASNSGIFAAVCQLTLEDADLTVVGCNYGLEGFSGASMAIRCSNLSASCTEGTTATHNFAGGITLEDCFISEPENGKFYGGRIVQSNNDPASAVTVTRCIEYPLIIDGVQVTSLNMADVLENGVFSYDPEQNVLTISGNYTGGGVASDLLRSELDGLVIETPANVFVDCNGKDGLYLTGDTTVTGSGSLSLVAKGTGIYIKNSKTLTLDTADVYVTGLYPITGTGGGSEKLVLRSAGLTAEATGSSPAISDFKGGITLEGCSIYEPAEAVISDGAVKTSAGGTATEVTVGPTPYPLVIDGVAVTDRNKADVLGDGVFAFDGDHTLTISGSYTGGGVASELVRSELPGLVIDTTADATLDGNGRSGFDLRADTTFTGSGALTVLGSSTGVFIMNGSALTIEGAVVSFSATYPVSGNSTGETLLLRGADLTATATGSYSAVADFDGGITLENCAVTSPVDAIVEDGRIKTELGGTAKTVVIESAAYPLTIDGVAVSGRNCADVLGNGVFAFDGDYTLTISGSYTGSGAYDVVRSELPGLVIDTTADATLSGNGMDGFYLLADTTFTGSGALTVIGKGTGIYIKNSSTLTVANTALTVTAGYPLCGTSKGNETLVLRDATLTAEATGSSPAISDFYGGITLEDCGIIAPAGAIISGGAIKTGAGGAASAVTIGAVELLITQQPEDQTAAAGSTATFTVAASGAGELSYQWKYRTTPKGDWTNVSAASGKTAAYSLTVKDKHNGYQYKCVVSDGNTTHESEIATLTVGAAQSLTITQQPSNYTGAVGSTATFTVTAANSAGELSYQWKYRTTPKSDWVDVSAASGKTAAYSLTVKARHNGYQYCCVVTDGKTTVESSVVTLTVG